MASVCGSCGPDPAPAMPSGGVAEPALPVVGLPVGGSEGVLAHLPRQYAGLLCLEGTGPGANHAAVLRLQSGVT